MLIKKISTCMNNKEDTKECGICKNIKPLNDFHVSKKGIKGRHTYCKQCSIERRIQYYKDNKERENEKERMRRLAIKEEWREWKGTLSCVVCGENEAVCLDFHHANPEEKEFNLGDRAASGWSFARLKEEAAKCVVVCSNCHRKIHAGIIEV